MKTLPILLIFLMALGSPLFAGDVFPIMFHPGSVDTYTDMPEDLAKAYPNHSLVMITFKPLAYAAAKDGSNLKDGEGSWLDRGMKPNEPGKIRFLIADGEMITHTLTAASGPFVFKVRNTGKGYFETVPLASPELQLISMNQRDAGPKNLPAPKPSFVASCVSCLRSWSNAPFQAFFLGSYLAPVGSKG